MSVEFFKADRGRESWLLVIRELADRGYIVNRQAKPAKASPATVSIALSGQFENPMALKGRRTVVFDEGEYASIPGSHSWFRGILSHYYHDVIDITGMSFKEAVDKIVDYAQRQQADNP